MPVKIKCPNPECGRAGSVADDFIGKSVRCPQCKTRFAIPPAEDQAAAATAEQGPATVEHLPVTEDHLPDNLPATEEHVSGAEKFSKKAGLETVSAAGARSTLGRTGVSTQDIPAAISRFQVRGVLGAGAFGTVYRAFDPQLDREVALKVPQPGSLDSPLRVERFLREAKTAAKLRHPSIVPIYEAGQEGDLLFIASAFIEGQTLAQLIEDGPVDIRRAVEIVRALAEALACAHERDIVHRDVKPANIMIDQKGLPLLMDFGLAYHNQEAAAKLTQAGTILGTPAYMPPEQAKGQTDDPQPAGDQYSLGVVLYELLCGKRPFRGTSEVVLFNAIHTPPPSPRDIRPGIPLELEQICLRTLSKRPPERFPTCQALADNLGRWLDADRKARELPAQPVRATASVFATKPEAKPSMPERSRPERSLERPVPPRPTAAPPKKAADEKGGFLTSPLGILLILTVLGAAAFFLWPKGSNSLPLDGTWTLQSMQVAGQQKPDAKGIIWVIKGDALITEGKKDKGSIKTDTTKDPHIIDVVEDGVTASGICQLEGDVLTICFGTREGKRPAEFSSTAKNRQALLIMEKKKD